MRYFSYDSKLSQVLLRLAQSCYLNLLWFICSLPVVTLGASTTALYSVTLKMARDGEGAITRTFFQAFRENLRQATVLWLILLGLGMVLGLDGYILYHLMRATTGPIAVLCTLALALVIVASVAWMIVLLYVFPLVASFVNTNFAMLQNALFIGAHYLFCTILLALVHFAMFFIVVRFFTPFLIFGEGLCACICSLLLVRVIDACSPSGAEEDGEEDGLETGGSR